MAQQTAVEWLDESLQQNVITIDYVSRIMILEINIEDFMELKNKAKQMEKEQIVEAFDCDGSPQPGEKWISNGEQYYNETYCEYSGLPSVKFYEEKGEGAANK